MELFGTGRHAGDVPERWWAGKGLGQPVRLSGMKHRDAAVLILVCLAVWFYADVANRGKVDAEHLEVHRTDFTVFTEAGAAFFDGRDPYAVKNPRGWFYLYPPIFALSVAPLARLDTVSQVFVWYVVSVALGFGCFGEARRIWRLVNAQRKAESAALSWWVACGIAGAVALPALECLQRGQLGIALLYGLLLGFRLVLEDRGRAWTFLGGVVLAWTAVVKLIPALPVAVLFWQRGGRALVFPKERTGVASLGLGLAFGGFVFLLAIPMAVLGWDANIRHLDTWVRKVVTNRDPAQESGFHLDSSSNQSFNNAAHSLATNLRFHELAKKRAELLRFAKTAPERRWAIDRAFALVRRSDIGTHRVVQVIQGLMLILLLALALSVGRNDLSGQTAVFGLACLGMLLISPVAWTHYYLVVLPAILGVPRWMESRGRPRLAAVLACFPAILVCSHYLLKRWLGEFGLLGLGIAVWYLTVSILMLRTLWFSSEAKPGPRLIPMAESRSRRLFDTRIPGRSVTR